MGIHIPCVGEGEWVWDQAMRRFAIKYALAHPMRELKLVAMRFVYLYRSDLDGLELAAPGGSRRYPIARVLSEGYYLCVMALFAVSLALGWRRRKPGGFKAGFPTLGVWLVVCWTAFNLATFGHPRHHYASMPWIMMYAAWLLACVDKAGGICYNLK